MPSFLSRLTERLKSWLPVRSAVIDDGRGQPPSAIPHLTAPKMAGILRDAESGNTRELFCLYRDVLVADSHIQGELAKRILAVLGDAWTIAPADKTRPEDVAAADILRAQLNNLPGWTDACVHLLKASIWPVAVLERTYRPSVQPGLVFDLAALKPVPDVLIDYQTGHLRIENVNPDTGQGTGSYDERPDKARYIFHRGHMLSLPDNWGGPMRSLLYWFLLQMMSREWWARFLDRFATPFVVGKFDRSDTATRKILERALSMSNVLGGIVVNREAAIELHQTAASQTGDAFEKFMTVCQKEKSKLILGQTLSATSDPTGMGGGAADLQGEVRNDIRQWDAMKLGATVREQLFAPFLRVNGLSGSPPVITWGSDKTDAKMLADIISALFTAGLQVSESSIPEISKLLGGISLERAKAEGAVSGPGLPPSVGSTEVSDTALNGAQTQSLVSVVQAVSSNTLPRAAAMEILRNSFPRMRVESLKEMLDAAEIFDPAKAAAPAALSRVLALDASQPPDPAVAGIIQTYRGAYAPIRQALTAAQSPDEALKILTNLYPDWELERIQQIVVKAFNLEMIALDS